ncbi:MAG TPA: HPF/RaiA family ribosome-associated protein [Bacteroidales bacterium]|nr:HPF/RaiA family ribosome-associated protein [Bacteroidales bacterium]HCI55927.1 30S ribosomal protein S30 [Bacteroidales bacterium]HRC89081.1 HPF/RaiA family ribosome-associated protein [Bacteroidales bacterium]
MNIQIHSVRFDADKKLIQFINNKMTKLSKLGNGIINAEVYLKLDNDNGVGNKIAEIKVECSGEPLFARKQSKSFEESVSLAIDAIKKQIARHKDKLKGV